MAGKTNREKLEEDFQRTAGLRKLVTQKDKAGQVFTTELNRAKTNRFERSNPAPLPKQAPKAKPKTEPSTRARIENVVNGVVQNKQAEQDRRIEEAKKRGASGQAFREKGDRTYRSGAEYKAWKTAQDQARLAAKKKGK